MTPRDTTVMGLEGVLLGAHAEGVRNILAVTGDPPHVGDYPGSRGVYEVDSIGLVQLLSAPQSRRGLHRQGDRRADLVLRRRRRQPDRPTTPTLELDRFRRKVDAGARFAMTQALFDVELLDRFARATRRRMAGPGARRRVAAPSHAMALRLHNEVPGISVPGTVLDALRDAGADAPAVGLELARGLVEGARSTRRGGLRDPPVQAAARGARPVRLTPRPPPGNRLGGALPSGHAFGGRARWIDPMTLRQARPAREWPRDGRARGRPNARRSARVRLRAPHARLRRRDEGWHHERRRLPASRSASSR